MKAENLTVTIRAIDEATPVLRRLRVELWWLQHGGVVLGMFAGMVLFFCGLLVGHLT